MGNKNSGRKPKTKTTTEGKRELRLLDPEAVDVIRKTLRSPNEKLAYEAAIKVYEFNHGKASQAIELEANVDVTLGAEDYARMHRAMLESMKAADNSEEG